MLSTCLDSFLHCKSTLRELSNDENSGSNCYSKVHILVTFLPSIVHIKWFCGVTNEFKLVFYLIVKNCTDINYKRISKILMKVILDGVRHATPQASQM